MMLPGTAMRDIMMHNLMAPFLNLFRSSRVERSTRSRREARETESWGREERRHWWRALGSLASSLDSSREEKSDGGSGVYTVPQEPDHLTLSRRKRTVGLYSYAPWLTNNVR